VLGGQYTFHIIHLHEKYGPVIRINPSEIHVSTPEFYDVLYSGAGRRRHKWHWASRAFGADKSLFATVSHETHRMRRSALNPFFSMTKVRNLESVIQERVDAFLRRIAEFGNDGGILRLDAACAAYTAGTDLLHLELEPQRWPENVLIVCSQDVIVEYAFARSGRALEAPDFDIAFHKSCIDGGRQLFLTRQFPILLTLVKKIPYAMMLKINPSMASFFNMHKVSVGPQATPSSKTKR
jgi:hypothetical protein